MFHTSYDVIVVGGGHAGCEAATAAAKTGASTLLVSMNLQNLGQMSCNPAMGGIAKGQIVREIDALGGYSGIITDETMIQFRMLNRSKGPAMWSPRAQSDRMRFSEAWRLKLESTPGLDFWQDMVTGLLVKDKRVFGVKTSMGHEIKSKTVVLTNGTFLNGIIHIGEKQFGGGRAGEAAAKGITEQLVELGFESGRMKTGTPPRVDGRSLDFTKMELQEGDEKPGKFSFTNTSPLTKQRPCHISYTNQKVHDILKTAFHQSPMFTGRIGGLGPRYCPSIEDKIDRFADKNQHQLFIEPEGWETCEIYVNGFSSSLPEHIQHKALSLVPGFENFKMFRPGYAIEYDYFPPTQLNHSLETKLISGLYFSGQINGTTGYEEAACQGLVAGLNASRQAQDLEPIVFRRDQAYIGVLIDDLITKGTDEPYRMFTSRAEYRLLLRQDNADSRLTPLGHSIGLASDQRLERVQEKEQAYKACLKFLEKTSIDPDQANGLLESLGSAPVKQKTKIIKLLLRPEVKLSDLSQMGPLKQYLTENPFEEEILEQVEIQAKYAGYFEKEKEQAAKLQRLENLKIPEDIDFHKLASLSHEAKEKLTEIKPESIAQAQRISGVNPSDISVLLVYLGR